MSESHQQKKTMPQIFFSIVREIPKRINFLKTQVELISYENNVC